MDYLISCDWFQYCCSNVSGYYPTHNERIITDAHDSNGERIVLDVVTAKEYHPIYKTSYTLAHKGIDILHVHYDPVSNAIPSHYVAVKVANRILYSGVWSLYLHAALRALRLSINNITRLDLCLDFQQFADGSLPYDFMRTYLQDSAKGEQTFIRKHSNQFTIVANKLIKTKNHPNGTNYAADKQTIQHHGKEIEVGFDPGEELMSCTPYFQTIRWGSRQSAVMVEMYNKSKELRDKHHKPYISALWQECGLIQTPDRPVYRIEISITSKGLGYQRFSTIKADNAPDGRTFSKLAAEDIDTQGTLEEIFWSYAAEYFTFYEYRSTCKWKKDMPIVQLFPRECIENPVIKPRTINKSHDTGRSERLAATTFERLTHQLIDLPDTDTHALRHVAGLMSEIGALKSARHLAQTQEEQRAIQAAAYESYCDNLADERGRMYDAELFDRQNTAFANGEYNDLITSALRAVNGDSKMPAWKSMRIQAALDVLRQEFGTQKSLLGGGNLDPLIGNFEPESGFDCDISKSSTGIDRVLSSANLSSNQHEKPPY